MSLNEAIARAEEKLIAELKGAKAGINDRTGKGAAAERVVEEMLLLPYLRPTFRCHKGAVIEGERPDEQSPAIDRVVYDPNDAPPLIFQPEHCVFPIEAVCGIVEITMNLDATKLREDITRMAPVKAMRSRRFLRRIAGFSTRAATQVNSRCLSPRCFIVGLPEDEGWGPETIAASLRRIQLDLAGQTHVHGLYVVGIGHFETIPIEPGEQPYRIRGWIGPDRLFRFTDSVRTAFATWRWLEDGCTADLSAYAWGLGVHFSPDH